MAHERPLIVQQDLGGEKLHFTILSYISLNLRYIRQEFLHKLHNRTDFHLPNLKCATFSAYSVKNYLQQIPIANKILNVFVF